jgi:hypothetical protein
MTEPPQRDVTELVDVAALAWFKEHPYTTTNQVTWEDLPPLVKLDIREQMLPVVTALIEKIDGKPIFEIDPTIINDAMPVPDEQCGDYPAPCNCDDPFTHGGR